MRRYRRDFDIRAVKSKMGIRQMAPGPAQANLESIAKVMDDHQCDYWIMAGTLLGYARGNDFIKHDADTDVAVRMTTFSPQVLAELMAQGFEVPRVFARPLMYGLPEDGMEICVERDGIKTDLFFTYPHPSGGLYCSVYHDVREGSVAVVDYIYPDIETEAALFRRIRVRVPRETEVVLQAQYGPDWRVPVRSWNYATDPHNAVPRESRLDLLESHRRIGDYFRDAGITLDPDE